jgi:hypothetical protein
MNIEKACGIGDSFESRHFSRTNYECEVAGMRTPQHPSRVPNRRFSQLSLNFSRPGPEALFETAHSAMNNHAVYIIRALKASRITSRLNLRTRLSQACVQLISSPLPLAFPNCEV